ncbi:MAG: Trm112 family protein [Proteobacteria bacterium]|nr:Trm112 family protein [Pseudomonadota bacterium]
MEPDPKLLAMLVCPVTRMSLVHDRAKNELISKAVGLAYPIRGGVPVMLEGEARELSEAERS